MVKTTKSNTIVANKPVSKISSPIKSPKKEEESYDNENISDIKIIIKSDVTAYIQEAHMSILHCVCECLDKELR